MVMLEKFFRGGSGEGAGDISERRGGWGKKQVTGVWNALIIRAPSGRDKDAAGGLGSKRRLVLGACHRAKTKKEEEVLSLVL